MYLKIKFLILTLLFSTNIFCQQKSPNKASLLSIACPGLGQIYNKKYWKTPIILGCIGGAIYGYNFYNKKFNDFKDAYIIRTDNNNSTIDDYLNYSEANLITLQDYYRNQKDLTIILGVIFYLLNIADAYVDAHLFEYNINENLTLNFESAFDQKNHSFNLISLKIKLKE